MYMTHLPLNVCNLFPQHQIYSTWKFLLLKFKLAMTFPQTGEGVKCESVRTPSHTTKVMVMMHKVSSLPAQDLGYLHHPLHDHISIYTRRMESFYASNYSSWWQPRYYPEEVIHTGTHHMWRGNLKSLWLLNTTQRSSSVTVYIKLTHTHYIKVY